jgi:hypothetical protein
MADVTPQPPVARSERAGRVALVVATVALSAVQFAYYFPRVVDDLFISLRYAEHLSRGQGAVFNLGERVEGYSSPIWMLLQSLGFVLGVEGVTWTKLLGLAAFGATQYGLYALTRRGFGVRGWLAFVPGVFAAANSYFVNWTVLGLETPLHVAAVVGCPVALGDFLQEPTRRRRLVATLALVVLGTTRPESALYVAVNLVAPFVAVRSFATARALSRRLLVVAAPASVALGGLLALRFAYYGELVPNTYFVKGQHVRWSVTKLEALWAQGAGATEAAVFVGGAVLLLVFGVSRRCAAPGLSVVACLYFSASVVLDWMPSLRHLLPVTVLAPVGYAVLADALWGAAPQRWLWPGRLAAAASLVVVAHAAYDLARLDNRYSPEEQRGRAWRLEKSREKWRDTWLAYRCVEPPHVARMHHYEMGQISQSWAILETSAEPVEASWFVGRDIGAVGYYTGARIFDTAGLFTPAVSRSRAWVDRREVPDALVDRMMAMRPLGGEIYEGWEVALGRRPELLRGYRIRLGTRARPYGFIAEDRVPPGAAEILRRYEQMSARFPRLYHLHTLYGESVGAVVERRLRGVRAELTRRR